MELRKTDLEGMWRGGNKQKTEKEIPNSSITENTYLKLI